MLLGFTWTHRIDVLAKFCQKFMCFYAIETECRKCVEIFKSFKSQFHIQWYCDELTDIHRWISAGYRVNVRNIPIFTCLSMFKYFYHLQIGFTKLYKFTNVFQLSHSYQLFEMLLRACSDLSISTLSSKIIVSTPQSSPDHQTDQSSPNHQSAQSSPDHQSSQSSPGHQSVQSIKPFTWLLIKLSLVVNMCLIHSPHTTHTISADCAAIVGHAIQSHNRWTTTGHTLVNKSLVTITSKYFFVDSYLSRLKRKLRLSGSS